MSTVITAGDIITELRALVAQVGPEFVYQWPTGRDTKCLYYNQGAPSCGIGRVLSSLSVPNAALQDMDKGHTTGIRHSTTQARLQRHGFVMEQGAINVAYAFQSNQDSLRPYSEALAVAESHFKEQTP